MIIPCNGSMSGHQWIISHIYACYPVVTAKLHDSCNNRQPIMCVRVCLCCHHDITRACPCVLFFSSQKKTHGNALANVAMTKPMMQKYGKLIENIPWLFVWHVRFGNEIDDKTGSYRWRNMPQTYQSESEADTNPLLAPFWLGMSDMSATYIINAFFEKKKNCSIMIP